MTLTDLLHCFSEMAMNDFALMSEHILSNLKFLEQFMKLCPPSKFQKLEYFTPIRNTLKRINEFKHFRDSPSKKQESRKTPPNPKLKGKSNTKKAKTGPLRSSVSEPDSSPERLETVSSSDPSPGSDSSSAGPGSGCSQDCVSTDPGLSLESGHSDPVSSELPGESISDNTGL